MAIRSMHQSIDNIQKSTLTAFLQRILIFVNSVRCSIYGSGVTE